MKILLTKNLHGLQLDEKLKVGVLGSKHSCNLERFYLGNLFSGQNGINHENF